jgi:hypothetical protein
VRLTQIDLTAPEGAILYQRDVMNSIRFMAPLQPVVAPDTVYLDIDPVLTQDECAFLRIDDGATTTLADGIASCSLAPLTVFGSDALLAGGAESLQLLRATPGDDAPVPVADLGEAIHFSAHDAVATPTGVYFWIRRADGDELWRARDAVDPPELLHRFNRADREEILWLRAAGDGALLVITGGITRIWQSDGPSTSTRPIATLPNDTGTSHLAAYGEGVLLVASDVTRGAELWVIPQAVPCAGDCNASGTVAIDEVIRAVGIGLGKAPAEDCAAADVNADQQVSVDEIVTAVAGALDDCSADGPSR